MNRVAIVIPNWDGESLIAECVDSLLAQSYQNLSVIVVENGSTDTSLDILKKYGNKITILTQKKNLGFAGGVNKGIIHAMERNYDFIGLLNNDARANKDWVKELIRPLLKREGVGITTSKILIDGDSRLDSTGDWFTTTGMPFPRGRGEVDHNQYDKETVVFGGSGGASMYRRCVFEDIGLFDEDFFAYYEDVDLSFRAQLHGWAVEYAPTAIVYHKLSATSNKLGYFAVKQSAKNFWLLYIKNVPSPLFFKYLPNAMYRYSRMFAARLKKGGFLAFSSGFLQSIPLIIKKLPERYRIQKKRVATIEYIERIIYKGKPPIPPL